MDENEKTLGSEQIISKVVEMGFSYSDAAEAVKAVGLSSVDYILGFLLNDSRRDRNGESSSSMRNSGPRKGLGRKPLPSLRPSGQMRQSSILEHFYSGNRLKRSKADVSGDASAYRSEVLPDSVGENKKHVADKDGYGIEMHSKSLAVNSAEELSIRSDCQQKVSSLLQKHFGFSSLKIFQKEALSAWLAHRDCLVLAATGSGKSLCFQIPALLTRKVVVVVSPLISLMHDQCLKLARHGVAACFLGSGQPDNTVEQKAMRGMYSIIYACPETVLRLIKPLQKLAEGRGIALFAIDEVHCVSKWGHDFRPDYRRLSVLRENFSARNLKSLEFDIPLMALTATATIQVREDILESLCMSKETKIVLTSFFRPNLRFMVRHSRTSSLSSYDEDFHDLVETYGRKGNNGRMLRASISGDSDDASSCSDHNRNGASPIVNNRYIEDVTDVESTDSYNSSKEKEMSVEYLENDVDVFQSVDDWDVAFGEFCVKSAHEEWNKSWSSEISDLPSKPLMKEPLEQGPTIVYVPTRKETVSIAKYLCSFGVKAAAYNASLPKSHLRKVHREFHDNNLQVVVATVAFGMGIDKLDVRRVIHYGWPQSLEAYYQEAGRAGRDGKLADCILYANLTRAPSLLPSRRSEDQTKQAYRMLSDCFRYGMNTSSCRAKTLVRYFGEDFGHKKCLLCDVCVDGPPQMQNLREEAYILMQAIAAYHGSCSFEESTWDRDAYFKMKQKGLMYKPSLRMFVSKISKQSQKFIATDISWWRGLARVLESKGYIREADDKIRVHIKFPEPTKLGMDFLKSTGEQTFCVHPEADMQLAAKAPKPFSTFSEWGRGWADPEIRRQCSERKPWIPPRQVKRKYRKITGKKPDLRTVRGRLAAKLSK